MPYDWMVALTGTYYSAQCYFLRIIERLSDITVYGRVSITAILSIKDLRFPSCYDSSEATTHTLKTLPTYTLFYTLPRKARYNQLPGLAKPEETPLLAWNRRSSIIKEIEPRLGPQYTETGESNSDIFFRSKYLVKYVSTLSIQIQCRLPLNFPYLLDSTASSTRPRR